MNLVVDPAALRALVALAVVGLVAATAATAGRARPRRSGLTRFPLDAVPNVPNAPLVAFVFTSRLCAPCRETPALVAAAAPGLPLVPLPVERFGALARRLGIEETPTLLVVDRAGRVRYASQGNPTGDALRAAVANARATPQS